MKIRTDSFPSMPNVTVKIYEPEHAGEFIVALMIMSGKWRTDKITIGEVLYLADELIERFDVADTDNDG